MSEPGGQDHYLRQGPRRAVTLKGARRRAWIARWSRLLFFVALVAIGLPVAYFLLRPEPQPVEPDLPPIEAEEPGVRRATNPRFTGFDTAGRRFQVLADTAIQRPQGDGDTLELESPCFYDDTEDSSGDEVQGSARVCARGGVYDSRNEILDLEVDVNLETENGYRFTTSRARVFLEERRAEGSEPVVGTTASGTITADSWSYEQDGAILHFEGNVRTVFNREDGDATAEDAEE